jgi:hypothetical protein
MSVEKVFVRPQLESLGDPNSGAPANLVLGEHLGRKELAAGWMRREGSLGRGALPCPGFRVEFDDRGRLGFGGQLDDAVGLNPLRPRPKSAQVSAPGCS